MTLLADPPAQAPEAGLYTQCLSWRLDEDVVAVRCWSPAETEIQLCGHGLLCCGSAWQQSGQPVAQLDMNGLRAGFYADADLLWIGLPMIPCSACLVPRWVSDFFPVMPWRAAEAGDEHGYLVLEWPEDFDLRSLPTPPYSLHRKTRRALIATAKTPGAGNAIALRYFAPQHGVPEDTATGSAMRVLANYWRNRDLPDQLIARQCSTYGGALYSRIRGDLTWVGGRVVAHGIGDQHVPE